MRAYLPKAKGQVRRCQISGTMYVVTATGAWRRLSPRKTSKSAHKEAELMRRNHAALDKAAGDGWRRPA